MTLDASTFDTPTHVLHPTPGSGPRQNVLSWQDQEWLLTNGTGTYALGTAAGIPTRRYHGLLVAAAKPPVARLVLLSQMVEQLTLHKPGGSVELDFATLGFSGDDGQRLYAPPGHTLLRQFTRGLSVSWEYGWGELTFTRTLRLHPGAPAATITYQIKLPKGVSEKATLSLKPLIAMRDFHALMGEVGDQPFDLQLGDEANTLIVKRGDHAMAMRCVGTCFGEPADWWRGVHYPIDQERGQGAHEDLFQPGQFTTELEAGRTHTLHLTVTLGPRPTEPVKNDRVKAKHLLPHLQAITPPEIEKDLAASTKKKKAAAETELNTRKCLAIAADDFVVERTYQNKKLSTILAGYPWFADWGRDTFIALPGLLLETGRYDEARDVLEVFGKNLRHGLVPNRFDDYDDHAAHYNTVDASLWFVHGVMRYLYTSGDEPTFLDAFVPAVMEILQAYEQGTDGPIQMDSDGLIMAGDASTQLTWMDALRNGIAFTPRYGKCVEINALWHHCLVGMAELLEEHRPKVARQYKELARTVKKSYNDLFWSEEWQRLIDHWYPVGNALGEGGWEPDWSLRPNMAFAASLEHSPLNKSKRAAVIKSMDVALLTPFGPRTLPQDDAEYHGYYHGGQDQRDAAYHRGTVWPWLIGPYAEGVLRAGKFGEKSKKKARAAIQPLIDQMVGSASSDWPTLGQLYEIHEAEAPHRPVGTLAQAWSVAEVLRVLRLMETH